MCFVMRYVEESEQFTEIDATRQTIADGCDLNMLSVVFS
jgi:hypothetical protein